MLICRLFKVWNFQCVLIGKLQLFNCGVVDVWFLGLYYVFVTLHFRYWIYSCFQFQWLQMPEATVFSKDFVDGLAKNYLCFDGKIFNVTSVWNQDWNVFMDSFAQLEFCIHGNTSHVMTTAMPLKIPEPMHTTTPSAESSYGIVSPTSHLRYMLTVLIS